MTCPSCGADVLDIDVKCANCGAALGATGAQRMIGSTVLGQYELVDVLGQGGMSVVFKGRHKLTEQEVALKILPPELAAHSQVKSRFLEEAKALAALDHPNIVHLYNFGQENGSFVLAMQFVQGKTWERMILENKRLDWQTTCKITVDVLKALEYAHGRGIVHRDMKPSNVLVRAHDAMATVMDFGIAKMTTSTKLTATGQTMGTVRYMSPEQVRGQEVDLRTDIYSLGATMYESLVGDTPFDGSTHFEIMTKHLSEVAKRPSSLGVTIPLQIEDALMRTLSKRADERFETARDFRKVLEAVMKENDVALVETQRLDKELLAEVRSGRHELTPKPTSPERPSTMPRAATASELADSLEPKLPTARTHGKRSVWPWLLLALVLVAGGGGAAVMMLQKQPPKYVPIGAVKDSALGLKANKAFDDLGVLVETDGVVTPDQVAAAYRDAMAELKAFQPEIGGTRNVLTAILAIPPAAMCTAANHGNVSSGNCSAAATLDLLPAAKMHYLVIVDEPGTLATNMRAGVAHAMCDFQADYLGDDAGDKAKAVCKLTAAFAAAH